MPPIEADVAIIIYSRGRENRLHRLLDDLQSGFIPALGAGGLSACIFVYAQGYTSAYLDSLAHTFRGLVEADRLVVVPSSRPHARIGDVAHAAIREARDRSRYRLAMLMDDDSVYRSDPLVDGNLREAARRFVEGSHRAYSIKLGTQYGLEYRPFVDPFSPIMPFKEKMLWASREVLDEVLAVPRFAELSIGEDAVIAAVAWLADPDACFAVHGMATFLHLGFEPSDELGEGGIEGGYAELMAPDAPPPPGASPPGKYDEALRTGVTPHHVMPDIFVPESHPYYPFNGVRAEVIARLRVGAELVPDPA